MLMEERSAVFVYRKIAHCGACRPCFYIPLVFRAPRSGWWTSFPEFPQTHCLERFWWCPETWLILRPFSLLQSLRCSCRTQILRRRAIFWTARSLQPFCKRPRSWMLSRYPCCRGHCSPVCSIWKPYSEQRHLLRQHTYTHCAFVSIFQIHSPCLYSLCSTLRFAFNVGNV